MTTLYVAEFVSVGGTGNFAVQGAFAPPIAEQTVAIGGSSVQCTNAFSANTAFVRLHTDSICSVAFGANPTASATNMRLALGQTEYFSVKPGHKVAVITNT